MSKTKTVLGRTLEEIKEEIAQDCLASNLSHLLVVGLTNTDLDYIAERYAQSQTQELIEWKESASKVFKNLDLQAIGKTLGIGLGEDVSVNVLPKIKELQEQNAELVEIVFAIHATLTNGVSIQPKTPLLPMMKELLTKYNHLNQKP